MPDSVSICLPVSQCLGGYDLQHGSRVMDGVNDGQPKESNRIVHGNAVDVKAGSLTLYTMVQQGCIRFSILACL